MHKTAVSLLRVAGLAALLGALATAAQARVNWSIGLDFGQPLLTTLPHGAVSVFVGGGPGRHWRHGHHHGSRPWRSHGPGVRWMLVAPPVVFPLVQPAVGATALPLAPSRPDPVIYPGHGQDAQQTELARRDCNRWSTTQPAALADASVFHRAVEACMDGRGYTMK